MKRYLLEVDDNATTNLLVNSDDNTVSVNVASKQLVITVLPEDPDEWPKFINENGANND